MNFPAFASIFLSIFVGGGIAFFLTVKYIFPMSKEGNAELQDKDFGAEFEMVTMTKDNVEDYKNMR